MKRWNAIAAVLCLASVAQAKPLAAVVEGLSLTQEAEDYSRRNTRAKHSWDKVRSERDDIPDHLRGLPADNTVFELNNKDFEKKSPAITRSSSGCTGTGSASTSS